MIMILTYLAIDQCAAGLVNIQQEAVLAASRLQNLGIFSSVDVLLEAPDDLETPAAEAVCAIITVQEKGRRQIYAGTTMQGSGTRQGEEGGRFFLVFQVSTSLKSPFTSTAGECLLWRKGDKEIQVKVLNCHGQ